MNLKRELVKNGNYFFQPVLHLRERDPDTFSGKPFDSIIPIGIGFFGFASSQRMTVRAKRVSRTPKKTVTAMKM